MDDAWKNEATTLVEQGKLEQAATVVQQSLEALKTQHGENHQIVAECYFRLALVLIQKKELDEALTMLKKVMKTTKKIGLKKDDALVVDTSHQMGIILYKQGKLTMSLTMLEKIAAIKTEKFGKEHEQVSSIFSDLENVAAEFCKHGMNLITQGRMDDETKSFNLEKLNEASLELDKAKDVYTKTGKGHASEAVSPVQEAMTLLADCYRDIAIELFGKPDYPDDPIFILEKAFKIYNNVLGGDDAKLKEINEKIATIADSYYNTALKLISLDTLDDSEQDQLEKSGTVLLMSLETLKLHHGENHQDVAEAYFRMASVRYKQEKLLESLDFLKAVIKIKKQIGHKVDDKFMCDTFFKMGTILYRLGNSDQALTMFEKSDDLNQSKFGDEHEKVSTIFTHMKTIAGELRQNGLELVEQIAIPMATNVCYGEPIVTDLDDPAHNLNRAFDSFERAMAVYKRVGASDNSDEVSALHEGMILLADVYSDAALKLVLEGKPDDALLEKWVSDPDYDEGLMAEEAYEYDPNSVSEALGIYEKKLLKIYTIVFGNDSPKVHEVKESMAQIAESYYKTALVLINHSKLNDASMISWVQNPDYGSGHSFVDNPGDVNDAIEKYEESVEIYKKALGDIEYENAFTDLFRLSRIVNAYLARAMIHQREDFLDKASHLRPKLSTALKAYKKALEILEKFPESDLLVAGIYCNMASIFREIGNLDESLKMFVFAGKLYRKLFGTGHQKVAECDTNIENALNALVSKGVVLPEEILSEIYSVGVPPST